MRKKMKSSAFFAHPAAAAAESDTDRKLPFKKAKKNIRDLLFPAKRAYSHKTNGRDGGRPWEQQPRMLNAKKEGGKEEEK